MNKTDIIPTPEELHMLQALRFMDNFKIQKEDSKTCAELTSFMDINDSYRLHKLGNVIGSFCGMPKEAENLSIETISNSESNAVSEIDGQWRINTKCSYGSTVSYLELFFGKDIYVPINGTFKTPESILRFIHATRSKKTNLNKLCLRASLKKAAWGRHWAYLRVFRNNSDGILTKCQIKHVMPIIKSWDANTMQPHISPYTINHTLD